MNTILSFLPAGWGKHKGGGEWAGPCPNCGGEDRFVVWPEHPSGAVGGKYLCRGCSAEGGDGIQFLRDFLGMSYPEACKELGADADAMRDRPKVQAQRKEWEPKEERVPGEVWQKQALAFLPFCREHA
ncbi:zinc-binding protein, partial [Desulfovibrio sp. OttesenSCG-928-G15]|nr:zinc-binding protein [Desulfovibrio sp. OttesenSCG-928-G15]